jgi:23S rRNA (adenine2503-C2)-methyltransferase
MDISGMSKSAQNPALPILPATPEVEFTSARSAADQLLFGLDEPALGEVVASFGEPAYRARQIAEGVYKQRFTTLDEFTTLPIALRRKLADAGWSVGRPAIAQVFTASDRTERYLIEVNGAQTVETVWMPESDGGEDGEDDGSDDAITRSTICVSSQIGCAVNCQFCLTAKLGLTRNLTAGEIAGQVVSVLARHGLDPATNRINLVFMGMGEPFLNYANFAASARLLAEQVGISPRRMTVSTSGILPGIELFAAEPVALRPRLAISLNAPNNQVRDALMPINRKWPIETLIAALRRIPLRSHERITFEYVLLGGHTDQPEHAVELARLVRRTGLPVKVNLIAWNPGPDVPYETPDPAQVESFRQSLIEQGIPTYLRKPRGRDIYAACGQLKKTIQ